LPRVKRRVVTAGVVVAAIALFAWEWAAAPRVRASESVVRQLPSVFRDHNAFQALATRSPVAPYTRRVPTFWVSKGAPRLGWCWAGNPHSWLGAASAARRLAPVGPAP